MEDKVVQPKASSEKPPKRGLSKGSKVAIIIAAVIMTIGSIGRGILEYNTERLASEVAGIYDNSNVTGLSKISESRTDVDINVLSFSKPSSWKYEYEADESGLVNQVTIESSGDDADIATIVWVKNFSNIAIQDYSELSISNMKEEVKSFVASNSHPTTFRGNEAYEYDFTYSVLGFKYYGVTTTFIQNGYLVQYMKVSNIKSHINSIFKAFDESIDING